MADRELQVSAPIPGRCGLCGAEGTWVEVPRDGRPILVCPNCCLDILNAYSREDAEREAEACPSR